MAAKGLLALGMLWHSVLAGVLAASQAQHVIQEQQQQQQHLPTVKTARRLQGRFLHITDIHLDEFYKVHSSTAEEDACHRGKGLAGSYGAETSDCDSPYSLVNATFDWIADNLRDQIDFVIWTGDSARHDGDEKIPRSAAQVLGSNHWVTSKFLDALSDPESKTLAIPVVPTFGNNDILPHNVLLPGPNKWLKSYASIWKPFIPEEQRHSFEFGGWFYVEVIPNKLAVFSLNTLYFFDRNAGVDDCAQPSEPGFKQMEWLHVQLEHLRHRGMKAILMGHVPPARTDSKTLWDETCWQKYTLWLRQFRDVVVGSVYGHMNIDHFVLQDTKELDLALLGASEDVPRVRTAMEDEMSVKSTADYLRELRAGWSRLPNPLLVAEQEGELNKGGKKKKKPHKDLGGPLADRFQLSLVSPSVVPNYFPTLRVIEYNISGLEDTPVWGESESTQAAARRTTLDSQDDVDWAALNQYETAVREALARRDRSKKEKESKKKKKKKKKPKNPKDGQDKKKRPKDPNLVIPDPPAKSAPPGPAYLVQALTFLGYTQYYANLTHINNDMTHEDETSDEDITSSGKWREGMHGGKKPKTHGDPRPRAFEFQVEYSTFTDKIYNLTDLTVQSFVTLAYQMGQVRGSNVLLHPAAWTEDEREVAGQEFDDDASELETDTETLGKKRHRKGNKKEKEKQRHKKAHKTWIHFLTHAFVSSVEPEELEKL